MRRKALGRRNSRSISLPSYAESISRWQGRQLWDRAQQRPSLGRIAGLLLGTIMGSPEARKALIQGKDFRATAPLARALGQGDPTYRMHIAETLGDLGDVAAVPALIEFIERQDRLFVPPADPTPPYWALVKLKDPRAMDTFLAGLGLQKQDALVRQASAWGMSGIMDSRAIGAALAGLNDPNPGVRAAAAWAFKKLPVPEAMPVLLNRLLDPVAEVREGAVFALSEARLKQAREPIRAALQDDADIVRAAAAWGLVALNDPQSADTLLQLIGDPSAKVREAATGALGQLGLPIGAEVWRALRGDAAARDRLARAPDPRLVEPLVALTRVKDPRTRRAALELLGLFADEKARDAIVDAAAGWNLEDRVVANRVLLSSPATSAATKAVQLLTVLILPISLAYLAILAALGFLGVYGWRAARRWVRTGSVT